MSFDFAKNELERRELIEIIVRDAKKDLIANVKRVRVGVVHAYVAGRLGVVSNSELKKITNEFLKTNGIKRVVVHGYPYFRVN